MSQKPKGPGNWTDVEDRNLRCAVLARQSPAQAATKLNRLEKSVILRAQIIGCPFQVKPCG